jgi:hypothetical protein
MHPPPSPRCVQTGASPTAAARLQPTGGRSAAASKPALLANSCNPILERGSATASARGSSALIGQALRQVSAAAGASRRLHPGSSDGGPSAGADQSMRPLWLDLSRPVRSRAFPPCWVRWAFPTAVSELTGSRRPYQEEVLMNSTEFGPWSRGTAEQEPDCDA